MICLLVAQAAGEQAAADAPLLSPFAQGHRLDVNDAGPVVQPVRVPAQPQMVTAVPRRDEVWAVGVSAAPSAVKGYDSEDYNAARQVGAQAVFLHWDVQHGWQSAGAPMENGIAHHPAQISVLSVAADGEGWAQGAEPDNPSGNTQVMYHKSTDSTTWDVVETPVNGTTALSTSANALSVNSDGQGTFGTAVLHDGTVLELANGVWQQDSTGVDTTVVRVVAASRTLSLAVGGSAADQFQSVCVNNPQPQACLPSLEQFLLTTVGGKDVPDVFVRNAAGWGHLQVPTPQHGATALSLAAGPSTAWIGGATQGTPWVVRLDFNPSTGPSGPGVTSTSWCSPSAGPCDRGFPDDTGAIFDLERGGADMFAAGAQGELFHLSSDAWSQEPSAVGPVGGVAFTSARDGWIARLDSYYGVGAAYDPPVLGHYTYAPDRPLLRSWPDAHGTRLTAVAVDPAGTGVAMAGGDGAILRLDPDSGLWSPMAISGGPLSGPVRAISWPRHDQAWAVAGSSILRFDGIAWHTVPVQGDLRGATLYSVAVSATAVQLGAVAAAPPPPAAPPPAGANAPTELVDWGDNQDGELGDGSDAGHAVPAAVPGTAGVVTALGNVGQETPGQSYDYFSVALVCSAPTSCARDGRVLQWGRLLGPARITQPQPVAGLAGHPIVALSAGGDHVLALDSSGTVWAWGDDAYSQLGDGGAAGSSTQPLQVKVPNVVGIAAGARHSLAVDSTGTVWCWGDDSAGQCGQPSAVGTVSTPTPVPGLTGVAQVVAGAAFSLARTGGGAVMGWGDDSFDQLGRDNNNPVVSLGLANHVPIQVPGVTASSIAVGEEFAVAVNAAGGGVTTWGRNESGQLGTGSGAAFDLPHAVPGLSGVRTAVAAGAHAMVQTSTGVVAGWGQNVDGEVAAVGQHTVSTPLTLPGPSGARAIGVGRQTSYAVVPAPPPGTSLRAGTAPPPATLTGPFFGYAVGAGGLTVRFDGRAWTVDAQSAALTDQALHGVAISGRDAVAVGSNGAALVDDGNGWHTATLPQSALDFAVVDGHQRHLLPPDLTTVVALPDGTVLAGGERGTLLERDPGDAEITFNLAAAAPLEGWVHALAAHRDPGGGLRYAVVVGADPNVEADLTGRPEDTSTLTGAVLVGDGSSWRDAENGDAVQDGTAGEQSSLAPRLDDVEALGLDPAGRLGWAVGTGGSTWRVALQGTPPASPMAMRVPLDAGPGTSFAYIAETGCLQGVCRHQLGWSVRGDVVLSEALRAAGDLARRGGLDFVTLGGDLRQPGGGNVDDLAALRPLFDSVPVPVFGAVGSRDLLNNAPSAWEQAYGDRPAPWGGGRQPGGVAAVPWLPGAVHHAGANTHYAFDVVRDGVATLRVIVLDTSSLPLAAADRTQNPTESQAAWLLATLLDARSLHVPAIIVMNRLAATTPSSGAGDVGVDAALRAAGAAGVLAAGMPANQSLSSGAVPVGVFGGGGGRFLAAGQTNGDAVPGVDPLHGYYFSWQLVTLAPGANTARIRSIPVLADVALDAPHGQSVPAGSAISLSGVGRFPRSARFQSYGSLDSEYTPTTLGFPFPRHCGTATPGGGAGCSQGTVAIPDYRFSSDDQSALVPVQEDPARLGHPLHDAAGRAVLDPTGSSGLFCATRAGTRTVTLSAGTVAARLAVTITAAGAGAGECARVAVPAHRVQALSVSVQPPAHPQVPEALPGVPLLPHQHAPNPPQLGVAAPPPVNPIPAPPGGAPGGEAAGDRQKEEELEAAKEDAAMTALHHGDGGSGDLLGFGAAALATIAAGWAAGRGSGRRRGRAAAAWVGTPPLPPPGRGRRGWR